MDGNGRPLWTRPAEARWKPIQRPLCSWPLHVARGTPLFLIARAVGSVSAMSFERLGSVAFGRFWTVPRFTRFMKCGVNHGEPYRIVSSLQQLLLFCFETCYTGVSQSHIIELVLFLHTSIKVFYQFRLRWHAQQDMRAWHFVLLDWQQSMNSAENRHHTWHFWTHLVKILLKPSHRRPERRKVQRQVGAPRFWGYAK